jgi:hypothetical protein
VLEVDQVVLVLANLVLAVLVAVAAWCMPLDQLLLAVMQ